VREGPGAVKAATNLLFPRIDGRPVLNWIGKFLIGALTGLAAVLLVCAVLLTWRLSRGPIALDFLTPLLQNALNDNTLGVRVELGEAMLDWSEWSPSLPITVRDVRLLDALGQPAATVPRLAVRLSVRALFHGEIAPTAIELIGPRLRLVRHADGSITLPGAQPLQTGKVDFWQIATEVMGRLAASRGALSDLKRFQLRDADLSLSDDATGQVWHLGGGRIDFQRGRDLLTAAFDFPIRLGAAGWHISGAGSYVGRTGRGSVRVGFNGLRPALLPPGHPWTDALRRIDMPLTGQVVVSLSDGKPTTAFADLSAGPGMVAIPEFYPAPQGFDLVTFRGRYAFAMRRLEVEQFGLRRGATTAKWHGRIDFGQSGWKPAVTLAGELHDVPLDTLMALWPARFDSSGRDWVSENILTAQIPKATFRIAIPEDGWSSHRLAEDAIDVTCSLQGTSARYLGQLPPLSAASGTLHLTAHALHVAIDRGVIRVPETGDLQVHGGTVVIAPLDEADKDIDITVRIGGPAPAVLGLLDHPPLGYATAFGLLPRDVSGKVDGNAHFRLPAKKHVKLSELAFDGAFRLADFGVTGVTGVIGGLPLTGGDFTLQVTRQAISGQGTGRLGGAPATIGWTQHLNPAQHPTQFTVKARLTDDNRKALGIDLAPYVVGPIGVDLQLDGDGAKVADASGTIDLGAADMTVDALVWHKPAGQSAVASVQVAKRGNGFAMPRLTLHGAGIDASANGTLTSAGKLDSLVLDRLAVGKTTGISGRVRKIDGVWRVRVSGETLDATGLLKQWLRGGDSKPLPPFTIEDARVEHLWLADDAMLSAASLAGSGDGKRVERLALRGAIATKGPLAMQLVPVGQGARTLSLTAPDGGFVLRALNLTRNVRGGILKVDASLPPSAPGKAGVFTGKAEMRDFSVQGAPALAKLLTLASLTGVRDILLGRGVSFDRLELPFESVGDSIRVLDASAIGSQIGITANGTVDRKNDTLNVQGTLAPIYTLNSLLGHVPVLGKLVRGKEGLIALRYGLEGPMKEPRVSINPLSVLTPGILRGIFDLMKRSERAADAPHPAAPTSTPTPALP
jgi:hypothetical protein